MSDMDTYHDDETIRALHELGIPVTRENYLWVLFEGDPPKEPLDGVIEAELPPELRRDYDDINNSPSAGDSDEPRYETPSGVPICGKCGKSTRKGNALVCAPCRNRTRLVLTDADKKFLKAVGIAR